MTDKFATQTLSELAKAGVLFLVMGIAIWALWTAMVKNDEKQEDRIEMLEHKTEMCQQENYRILMDQLSKTTDVIERNTSALTNMRH